MKTGLRKFISKITFLLLILFSVNLNAQIQLNGFCRYRNFFIKPGYTSLLAFNYNEDSYTDFLSYNPNHKRTVTISGDMEGDLSFHSESLNKHKISSIKNLSFDNHYSDAYVFISRSERTAGIVKFRNDGQPVLLNEYKFSSYPEYIDVADAQLDHAADVLVSGPSFDGISMLKIIEGKISEEKIISGTPFRHSLFIDYTNDGYKDIAAVNLYNTSIDLYRNNSRGKFELSRTLNLGSIPFSFQTGDIDLDGYPDMYWSSLQNITVLYGDAYSSYYNKNIINTEYSPHIVITGDYNSDGLIDLVYADTSEGIISALFARDERSFSEEFHLIRKEGIKSIVPYYSKFINGIAAFSSTGNIYIIDKVLSFNEEISLTAGIAPSAVMYFDYKDDGLTDFCFIDEEDNSLNFVIRNTSGIPEYYYKYSLHRPHKEIIIDNFSKTKKVFYCWTPGEKLIEIITADFARWEFSRNSLYAAGNLEDVKIHTSRGEPAVVFSAYLNKGIAGASVFEFHDFRYRRTDYKNIAEKVINIGNYFTRNEPGFLIWQMKDKPELYKYPITRLASPKLLGKLKDPGISVSFSADIFNTDVPVQLVYSNDNKLYIAADDKVSKIELKDSLNLRNKNQLWFGAAKPGGLRFMFIYNPDKKTLNRITLFNKRKNLILSELISGINVNRYFIRNMTQQDYHIIYTDPVENCITVKPIK